MRGDCTKRRKKRTRKRASCFNFFPVCLWIDDFVHGNSFQFVVVVVCNGGLLLLSTKIVILLQLESFGMTQMVVDGSMVVFTFQ